MQITIFFTLANFFSIIILMELIESRGLLTFIEECSVPDYSIHRFVNFDGVDITTEKPIL